MPKIQIVEPTKERKSGSVQSPKIPLNAYDTPLKQELKHYGKETLINVYKDMRLIREFETMLNTIKTSCLSK